MYSDAAHSDPPSFRVATLNLWGDDTDWERRLAAVAHEVGALGLDVLLVQESVVATDGTSRAGRLADALGFQGYAEHAMSERGDGAWLANAVLARTPVRGTEVVQFDGADAEGRRRGAVFTWWETPAGRTVLLGSVQLAKGARLELARWQQAAVLDQAVYTRLASVGGPVDGVVVGGDLGCGPESQTRRWLAGLEAEDRDDPTVWTDVWDAAPEGAEGATCDRANPWAVHLSALEGRDARYGPRPVREDALLVAGEPWGTVCGPMSVRRCFDSPVEVGGAPVVPSLHYGVAARLMA